MMAKTNINLNNCEIHPNCFHKDTCTQEMCLLFFKPEVTWDDLKKAIREWRKRYPKTDIGWFIPKSRHLFKTPLIYKVMDQYVRVALLEVEDE